MANPLYNALGKNTMPGPMGNFQQMVQQFNQFKNTFKGDPKQKVQELVNSGQISQTQLDQLQNAARQFMSMMGK